MKRSDVENDPSLGTNRPRAKPTGHALLALTFLLGCAAVDAPDVSQSPNFEVRQQWAAFAGDNPQLVDDNWLRSFGSAKLIALVDEALVNNRDLRIASANVVEAQALARRAGANLSPDLTGSATIGRENEFGSSDDPRDTVELGLSADWEVDVWGSIRNGRNAAALDAVSQERLYESARLSIAAQVTDAWIVANGNRALLAIAREEVGARDRTLGNIRARVAERSALGVDENRARANLAVARADAIEAERRLHESVRVIEVLLGRFPDAQSDVFDGLPRMTSAVTAGLPSGLLERRPDIIAAERAVAAAFYRTSEAQAARLPRITLSANVTGSDDSLSSALDPENVVWGLFGGLIAPILNGGELAENVNIATARQQIALETYAKTALEAFKEVEDALANQGYFLRQLQQQQVAAQQFRDTVNADQERFTAGEIDLFRLADTQSSLFDARREVIRARVAHLRNRVALHLALGGSFSQSPQVPGQSG
ncbi:MAG: efflux transporter outer membrane subunit [Pseudomonadota bacterium]